MRRIAVLTTSRADYGLLRHLMRLAAADRACRLLPIVCGSHLSRAHGMTVRELEGDGFRPAARVATVPRKDTHAATARALGRALSRFASMFERLRPDLLVVLGDRQELLSACAAAVLLRLPIAHIHGGEATEGVLDEQVRHAVSKLAHLHFPAAERYRRRLLRMGEDPQRVFNFGAPGLDAIARARALPRAELERRLRFRLDGPLALLTLHPCALAGRPEPAEPVLRALDAEGLRVVATYANADPGGARINARLERWALAHPERVVCAPSLGQDAYYSLVRLCSVVIGNSSSGIIEAPALKVPTVNIGRRQDGRLRAPSVIDCPPDTAAVRRALRRALSPAFRRSRCRGVTPYGSGDVARRILAVLKSAPLGEPLLRKSFHE